MKMWLKAAIVAAAVTVIAGPGAPVATASAASMRPTAVAQTAELPRATDFSARRYYRHYHHYGYRPYYYARPYYYRPYPYYAPAPFPLGFGFGPWWW